MKVKMTQKQKQKKIKAINEQLAQIDQQIQQAKLEAQQEKVQEAAAKNAAQAAKKQQTEESGDTGVVIAASLSQLVFASSKSTQLQSRAESIEWSNKHSGNGN